MEDHFELLRKFLAENTIADIDKISRDSDVRSDLILSGDDAIEFILKYSKYFKVDVSNFMAADYVEPEGDKIFPFFIGLITGRRKGKLKKLLVGHLEKGMEFGRLDEDVIASYNQPGHI